MKIYSLFVEAEADRVFHIGPGEALDAGDFPTVDRVFHIGQAAGLFPGLLKAPALGAAAVVGGDVVGMGGPVALEARGRIGRLLLSEVKFLCQSIVIPKGMCYVGKNKPKRLGWKRSVYFFRGHELSQRFNF